MPISPDTLHRVRINDPALTVLDLGWGEGREKLNDGDIGLLVEAMQFNTHVTHLDLTTHNITDIGAAYLSHLPSTVLILNLGCNSTISAVGAISIINASQLHCLAIHYTNLRNPPEQRANLLAAFDHNHTLVNVNVSYNTLDEGDTAAICGYVFRNGQARIGRLEAQLAESREREAAQLLREEPVAPLPPPPVALPAVVPVGPSALQPELMGGGDYHCMPLIPTFLGFSDRSDLERGFQEDLKRNVEMRQKLEWDRKVVEGCSWGAILIMASLQSVLSKTGNLPEDAVLALGLIQLLLTLTIASARGFSKYRAERIDGAIDASIHLGAHRNYFLREAPKERPPEIENSEDVLRKRFIS